MIPQPPLPCGIVLFPVWPLSHLLFKDVSQKEIHMENSSSDRDKSNHKDVLRQLKSAFEKLPHDIFLYLFTSKEQESVFSQATRQVIQSFQEISSRIKYEEHDLSHELAAKWKVEISPTLLMAPDRYSIRWTGAPIGEEGRTFVESLILIGLGKSNLSDRSLKIVKKINSSRKIKVFVSPTCPYCPFQAVNAIKAAIEIPRLVSLEIIDIQCHPELAEKYDAYSVPLTFSNDVLIAQGAQSEELFIASLYTLEEQTVFIPESDAERIETELVIVGGGPAGLTAGIYGARSGLKSVVVEKGALGGQVAMTPVVENYPGFTQVGGKSLVDIMVSHALQYVQIFQGEEVIDITPGQPMEIITSRRTLVSKAVLLATGATYRKLDVPGESRLAGRGVSYCSTCDGPLFKGKKAVMVGGGNSAVTEALHLSHMGVHVTLIHRRDALRAQEHLVGNLKENKIPILWNTEIKEIRGKERVEALLLFNNRTGETSTFQTSGVFVAIGYEPAVKLAKKIGVALTPEGYIRHDGRHRTNIPGVYSAGDVEGGYKQIVTAAAQGSEAAMTIFEDLIHPYWRNM